MTDVIYLKTEYYKDYKIVFSKSGFGVLAEIFEGENNIHDIIGDTKPQVFSQVKKEIKILKNGKKYN